MSSIVAIINNGFLPVIIESKSQSMNVLEQAKSNDKTKITVILNEFERKALLSREVKYIFLDTIAIPA